MSINAISVVIPHYGDPAPTLALIDQLSQQRGAPEYEIIVSDDCSPVPMPDGPGHKVVRRSVNGGFGAAVNSGIELARNDAVLVLNSDVRLPTDFLSSLVRGALPWWPAVVAAPAGREPGTGAVARLWPTARGAAVEWLTPLARFHGCDWLERAICNDPDGWRKQTAVLTDWVVGVCLLMPVSEVRAVGGFDERFFMNCEEIDLQRRLHADLGLPVVVLPGPHVDHVGGGSSDPTLRAGWIVQSRFRYHDKWGGAAGLLVGLGAASITNVLWSGARGVIGRGDGPVRTAREQAQLLRFGWRHRGDGMSGRSSGRGKQARESVAQ